MQAISSSRYQEPPVRFPRMQHHPQQSRQTMIDDDDEYDTMMHRPSTPPMKRKRSESKLQHLSHSDLGQAQFNTCNEDDGKSKNKINQDFRPPSPPLVPAEQLLAEQDRLHLEGANSPRSKVAERLGDLYLHSSTSSSIDAHGHQQAFGGNTASPGSWKRIRLGSPLTFGLGYGGTFPSSAWAVKHSDCPSCAGRERENGVNPTFPSSPPRLPKKDGDEDESKQSHHQGGKSQVPMSHTQQPPTPPQETSPQFSNPFRPLLPDRTTSPSKLRPLSVPCGHQADLTWRDDEITGHQVDFASGDDGYGINGIGFKPTPAMAYARKQRRRQQVSDWRMREAREARQNRIERRRGIARCQSGSEKITRTEKRMVRFADVG